MPASSTHAIQLLLVAATITLAAATNYIRGGGLDADARKSRQLNLFKEDRIIGGSRAQKNRYPYTVSMQDRGGHFCGGSLISRDFVLTAAHCLGGSYDVRIGSDSVGSGERIAMKREYEHPSYSTRTDEFDVALLKLDSPADQDIPLVRINGDNNVPDTQTKVTVMGWGDTDPSSAQDLAKNLMEVNLDVISNSQCEKSKKKNDSYNGSIYQSMLCTQTRNKDACQGDSGGPLVIKGNTPEEDIQVGIVSWGIGCAYLPGVFARVSRAHSWIKKTVCAQSKYPPAELCDLVVETPKPTARPTRLPTKQPTGEPTVSPSDNPTEEPTLAPTNVPSSSNMPSVSTRPSQSPSGSPSLSAQPSVLPTAAPSVSAMPSSSPSESPSVSGMPSASAMPSDAPSASPSESLAPSLSPSMSPTSSSAPTASVMPSAAPSRAPTPLPTSAAILPEDSLLISSSALIEPRDIDPKDVVRTADDVETADSVSSDSVARGAGTIATLCMGVAAILLAA